MFESNNIDFFLKREELLTVFHELITQIEKKKSLKNITFKIISRFSKDQLSPIIILDQFSLREIIDKKFDMSVEKLVTEYQTRKWPKVYIPTLRSLRQVSPEDLFKSRTIGDYFSPELKDAEIFTGHSMYEDLKTHLLGSHDKRQKVREFEKYLSENLAKGERNRITE